jgi:hypothetical protein
MKRFAALLVAGALVALMLLPVALAVNTYSGNSMLVADGAYPPPFPSGWSGTTLVADGAYPPPFPSGWSGTVAHGALSGGLLT